MYSIKHFLLRFKPLYAYVIGKKAINNEYYEKVKKLNSIEVAKTPSRTEIINHLLAKFPSPKYLEIGVRNPNDNYNQIQSENKVSVDPGNEYEANPVDYKMTSDDFFARVMSKEIELEEKFDLIFIDGLHLAEQVDRDITNALSLLKENGFIVLHDCNPPSEWHARETFEYALSPAGDAWNGTTWKAFMKWRNNDQVSCCCVDTDWGVGVISKSLDFGQTFNNVNPFFEFNDFNSNRKRYLNLISFEEFKELIN